MPIVAEEKRFKLIQGLSDMVVQTYIDGSICIANDSFCHDFNIGADTFKGDC